MNNREVVLQTKKERIPEIDIAKGIGMILVVYAHIVLAEPALTIIYSFHMPLFFILAGMVGQKHKYNSFSAFINNKFRKLIIPYLFFCILSILAIVFIRGFNYFFKHEVWNNAGNFFLNAAYSIIWAPCSSKYFITFNTPMWFVPCFFLVEIMYYGISHLFKNKALKYIVIIIISLTGWFMEAGILPIDFSVLPWNFSSACFSLGFFAIGDLLGTVGKKHFQWGGGKHNTLTATCLFILTLSIAILAGLLNGKVSIGMQEVNNGLLFYISGVFGTASVLCLSWILKKSIILKFMGQNSFTIMGTHMIVFLYVSCAFSVLENIGTIFRAIKNFAGQTWWTVLEFILTLLITLIFVQVYNYFLTRIKNKKNRHKES